MKLILKQYLASLKERGELDAILPDLLSQMGLNVFHKSARGIREHGVDVGAAGSVNGEVESVYLFSVKEGNLTRTTWDSNGQIQSLRPSLNEAKSTYIRSHLPDEHKDKPIVICPCFGGDVERNVSDDLKAYFEENKTDKIRFETWNGDRLAAEIEAHLLREELMPDNVRSSLRKAIALVDEPEVAFKHLRSLIWKLGQQDFPNDKDKAKTIRQMLLCLWTLFSWARDANNIESAYLGAELVLLHGWELSKRHAQKVKPKAIDKAIFETFIQIFHAYCSISSQYIGKVGRLSFVEDGLASAAGFISPIDTNLKLFDALGRMALATIILQWQAVHAGEDEKGQYSKITERYLDVIANAISNNPVLYSPIKDDQAIDISLVALCLFHEPKARGFLRDWLRKMIEKLDFTLLRRRDYPTTIRLYSDLLHSPDTEEERESHFQSNTKASILYPMLAVFASLLKDQEAYDSLCKLQKEHLPHCNYQLLYFDETSEERLYLNNENHGALLYPIDLSLSMDELLKLVFGECNNTNDYNDLSAVKADHALIALVACRHHRQPVPLHLFRGFM